MFAQKYLSKQGKETLIAPSPKKGTGIIVVVPCYNEPDILQTLSSLASCTKPNSPAEVVVVVNHPENEGEAVKGFNRATKLEIEKWIAETETGGINFHVVGPVELRRKWAGAGLARKTGMDEAVARFNSIEKPGGLIVSLDADTLVAKNYFVEIEKHFRDEPGNIGATISFRHQTEGLGARHLEGILLYEKYLWYYKAAVGFTGYPYSMFTVGSAFAVKAGAYVKRGGMNRRQAGEDFYFLQNLAQQGNVGEITATKVFPSARLSDRVPFGTGPILSKWMKGEEDLSLAYNFNAFADLKLFFDLRKRLFNIDREGFCQAVSTLPQAVADFIHKDNFWEELDDLNRNCSNLPAFQKRFFQKINAFKILKFLNFVHEGYYKKASLDGQIKTLGQGIKSKKGG